MFPLSPEQLIKTAVAFKTSILSHITAHQQMHSLNQQVFIEHLLEILIRAGKSNDKENRHDSTLFICAINIYYTACVCQPLC